MVLDSLGDSLKDALDGLRDKRGSLEEEDIDPIVKEIQRALIQSDVEVDVVQKATDNIKEKSLEGDVPRTVSPREYVLNIVYDELLAIVGDSTDIPLESQNIILAGLQGAGKTTSAAKLAYWFETKGLRSAVIQTDTFRPGAHQQLRQLTDEADIMSYTDENVDDPIELVTEGLHETEEADVRIIDTAGRHASEEKLIEEIQQISDAVGSDRNFLVIDAAMGSSVKEQSKRFNDTIGIDGVVITKMDGTAKGGGALSAIKEANTTISFLGTGEEVKDIERFNPDGFISRLLGMGDLQKLSERVERAIHESDEEDWDPEDLLEGEFTLHDMKKQMESMNQMGALDEIVGMLPGFGGILDKIDDDMLDMQEEKMRQYQIIMDSMTEKEMEDPGILDVSRKKRISRGSGIDIEEIDSMLDQYKQMNQFMGQIDSASDMKKMTERMNLGGGGGLGGMF